jgi:hypothetical protein
MRPGRRSIPCWFLLLASCAQQDRLPAAGWTKADPPPPPGEYALLRADPNRAAFLREFSDLDSVGRGQGVVLVSSGTAQVVDTPRANLPAGHPLRWSEDEGHCCDDRLLVEGLRIASEGAPLSLLFTEGPSGDPGFYVVSSDGARRSDYLSGEVLALPGNGEVHIYQRTNSIFPRHRRFHFVGDSLVEIVSSVHPIGLRTVALDSLKLRRSLDDASIVARVERGDSILVVEAHDPGKGEDTPILVRASDGAEGWVRVGWYQCNSAIIRGICFDGD